MITFQPLSSADMEQIRLWRNEVPETLRTPFLLTAEQQQQYYHDVICDRRSATRYWGFWLEITRQGLFNPYQEQGLVGYGGLENIQWENRLAEISLLIAPEYRSKGYGAQAIEEILNHGFGQLNLHGVWGECYACSSAVRFWEREVKKWGGSAITLPGHRKYWNGHYWPSLYFYFPDVNWSGNKEEDK